MSFRPQWKPVVILFADLSDERSFRKSYRPKRCPMGIRPLILDPIAEVPLVSLFNVDNLGVNNEHLTALEERFEKLHAENQGRCNLAARKSSEAISSLYGSAAELHNSVSDSLRVYSFLFMPTASGG